MGNMTMPGNVTIPARLKRAAKKFRLTPRETEVTALLIVGKQRKAIADALTTKKGITISPRTVDFHLAHIFRKVGAETQLGIFNKLFPV